LARSRFKTILAHNIKGTIIKLCLGIKNTHGSTE
jgi:hypothetical protein